MSDFVNKTMKIIVAIQHYIDKNGNAEAIDKYYQTHGTYKGIIEYLNNLEKENLQKISK